MKKDIEKAMRPVAAKKAEKDTVDLDELSISHQFLTKADESFGQNSLLVCDPAIPWSNFFYKIWFYFRRLFQNPYKQVQQDLNLLEQVTILINVDADELSEDTISRCEHLIRLHRITENTSARKRLEKWTKRVIALYLIGVFAIVLASACRFRFSVDNVVYTFNLSKEVLITILSTTTINVIGLALILMKGHFPHKEDGKQSEDAINKEA